MRSRISVRARTAFHKVAGASSSGDGLDAVNKVNTVTQPREGGGATERGTRINIQSKWFVPAALALLAACIALPASVG